MCPSAWKSGETWCEPRSSDSRALPVEQRDGQAMELLVRALGDDLVHDLEQRVVGEPAGDGLAHLLAVARQGGGKDLHSGEDGWAHDLASERSSRTSCSSSASVRVREKPFARWRIAFASGSSAGISWRASQCFTLESPLMGPISICCSLPNSPAGTPE